MALLSAVQLQGFKGARRLSFLTCYDYQTALWMNRTQLDGVLVGDSLSQVIYGLDHTSDVSMDTMLSHTLAVRKGLKSIHLMADMPYLAGLPENKEHGLQEKLSSTEKKILIRALKFREIGVNSVKIENPSAGLVKATLKEGIPVCGHIGLTPQTIHDFKKQGKDPESAQKLFDYARRLDDYGCFALLLEAIPSDLAERITRSVHAITIGIAAGSATDAQILVHYDLLGLTYEPKKFVQPYAAWGEELLKAVDQYIQEGQHPKLS